MKLIPYGNHLHQLQLNNQIPTNDVYVFIGDNAWDKAKAFHQMRPTTLCLPPKHLPFNYDWPVKGCDVLVFDTSIFNEDYIEDIILCLFKDGANIVRYISTDDQLTVFKKDFNHEG